MTMEDPAAAGRNCRVDHFQDQDSLLVKSAASAAREEATVFGAATVAIELRVDGARIWLVSHVLGALCPTLTAKKKDRLYLTSGCVN